MGSVVKICPNGFGTILNKQIATIITIIFLTGIRPMQLIPLHANIKQGCRSAKQRTGNKGDQRLGGFIYAS